MGAFSRNGQSHVVGLVLQTGDARLDLTAADGQGFTHPVGADQLADMLLPTQLLASDFEPSFLPKRFVARRAGVGRRSRRRVLASGRNLLGASELAAVVIVVRQRKPHDPVASVALDRKVMLLDQSPHQFGDGLLRDAIARRDLGGRRHHGFFRRHPDNFLRAADNPDNPTFSMVRLAEIQGRVCPFEVEGRGTVPIPWVAARLSCPVSRRSQGA
ncbi:MAG: hypothetical protein E5X13_09530 [Mesorhizobium sp.]|nr:MAG: hypothetical protein E5X13_09530 [Mesorhizobium sp.]